MAYSTHFPFNVAGIRPGAVAYPTQDSSFSQHPTQAEQRKVKNAFRYTHANQWPPIAHAAGFVDALQHACTPDRRFFRKKRHLQECTAKVFPRCKPVTSPTKKSA